MPFPPYEALHFVHCGLQRTAAPMEQMICSSCCWHLSGRFLGRRPCVKHTHVSTMIITTVFCTISECNTSRVKNYNGAFYKIRFLPGCFRSRHITSLANKLTCLRQGPIGKDVVSSNKLCFMVLMIAVRIFIADLPWIGSNCRWGKIDIIQGTFLCRVMSPLASLIKSQMLKHFAVCALQEHSHAG